MAVSINSKKSDKNAMSELVKQYIQYREQKKVIDDRMKSLAKTLKEYAVKNGVKDANGSSYVETPEGYRFGNQAKVSVSFDEATALNFLKQKGFTNCIEIKEFINESAVEERIESGDITSKDLEDITKSKTTYAIDVKKLEVSEEMPEVEIKECSAPIAASKKPVFKVKK